MTTSPRPRPARPPVDVPYGPAAIPEMLLGGESR